jgi:acetylornithine deacetylase
MSETELKKHKSDQPSEAAIKAAVAGLQDKAVAELLELVKCRSLRGEESSAQDVVQRLLKDDLKMAIDRYTVDKDQIKDLPGYSPVDWSLDKSEVVVGTYEAVDKEAK